MLIGSIEKTLINLLVGGSVLITLAILAGPVADPVNVSKFFSNRFEHYFNAHKS